MIKGLFFLLAFLYGCNFFQEKEIDPDTLHLCSTFDPVSFDPRIAGDSNSQAILHLLFEGLTRMESNGTISPAIAKEILLSDDQLTYTFILKKTYWSNGEPLTAYDFEQSWKKTISLDFISKYCYPFFIIKNVKAYREKLKGLHEVGIYAKSEEVFIVKLEHPAPYFMELISNPVFSPVHKSLNIKTQDLSHPSDFIGNGPFKINYWHFKGKISLEKNLFYWNAEKILLKNIDIAILPDKQVAHLLFEKGEIDWIGSPLTKIPQEALFFLKKSHSFQIRPPTSVYLYLININAFPFNNLKIRKAFSLAINREDIVSNFLEGNEITAFSILPPHLTFHKNPIFKDNDLEKAKLLFKEGLEELKLKKKDFPIIYLTHVVTEKKLPQIIQKQWKDVFNIDVQIKNLDWHSCLSKVKNDDFQLVGISWESWINDPIYNLRFHEILKKNINPEIARLLSLSDYEQDPVKRNGYLKKAEYKLIDEMYIIPIYFRTDPCLKKNHVKGIFFTPQGSPDFTYAQIDKK